RGAGQGVPALLRKEIGVPGYRDVASLGAQLKKAFSLIPRQQRLLIVFDDFVANPGAVYAQVLAFLGVPHDSRKEFPRVNEGQQVHHPRLWALIWGTMLRAYPLLNPVKRIIKVSTLNIYPGLSRLFLGRRSERPAIPVALREEMRAYFDDDIKLLSVTIGRDLNSWR